ncbi:UNVERIFIED_CONTAM: hypothetical protein NCL1_40502 [Trichonephila clavipes]
MMSILAGKANSFIAEIAFSAYCEDCHFCSENIVNVKRDSTWVSFVTRQISGRYCISVRTHTNKFLVAATNSFLILPRCSSRSRGNGGTKTTKRSHRASCPETTEAISATFYYHDQFDLSNVVGDVPSDTFSSHYANERPQTTEGTKCLLWFGGRPVDNFVHTEKADISKFGVSSSFQANFHHSLHIGYLEKNKEKWYILFRKRWDNLCPSITSRSGGAQRADQK